MPNDNIPNFYEHPGESIVRACVTSIAGLNPLTSALANAYFQLMDDKRWKHVKEFFENIRENMIEHEQKINDLYDKINPEEILDLMFIAIDNVQFEYQKDKRKRYADLFVNSILIGDQINFDEKKMFIQLFSELSDTDISLLGKFNRKSSNMIDLENYRKYGSSTSLEEVIPFVSRLESRGLIFEIPNVKRVTAWEGRSDNFDSIWRNKIYSLSPIGVKFSMFLQVDQ